MGNPEGIIFSKSLIFNAANNLVIVNVVFCRISECILDGATGDCVIIGKNVGGPNNISIKGCYLFSAGSNSKLIRIDAVGTSDSKILIEECEFVGGSGDNTNIGVYSFNPRVGIQIANNFITKCKNPLYFSYLNGSKVINNYGRANYAEFIYLQSDGANTIIDGNTSDDNFPILKLHPATSSSLVIGSNNSINTKTSFKGFVSMPASATQVDAPNNFYTQELYYRAFTFPIPENNLGSIWIENQVSWSTARIHCSSAPSTSTRIDYNVIAVPYSAT